MPKRKSKRRLKRAASKQARRSAVNTPASRHKRPAFVDISHITEYGLTQRLSRAVRVF